MSTPGEQRPVDLEGVPEEEGISPADAVDRLDEDPDKQVNKPDQDA
jgi:hypothetical protein